MNHAAVLRIDKIKPAFVDCRRNGNFVGKHRHAWRGRVDCQLGARVWHFSRHEMQIFERGNQRGFLINAGRYAQVARGGFVAPLYPINVAVGIDMHQQLFSVKRDTLVGLLITNMSASIGLYLFLQQRHFCRGIVKF